MTIATAPALSKTTHVELYPLHIGGDPDEPEIGRVDTGTFIALPPEGMEILTMLEAGLSVGQIETRFAEKFGQAPDLDDFVQAITGCGFVRAIDGIPIATDEAQVQPSAGWQLLANLATDRVAWLLSGPMKWVYAMIWAGALLLFVLRPNVVPNADLAWVHPRVMANAVLLTLLGWALAGSHEVAHLLAVRALGCPGYLGVSHRLHLLVAQTDLTAVRSLPRDQRYAPYLAGMTWDVTVLLLCSILRLAPLQAPVAGALAYIALISILSQFAFFLRTDIYFVLANWLRLGNLMDDTRQLAANRVLSLMGRSPRFDLSAVPGRELRAARWFAGLWLVGVAAVIGEFLVLGLPVLLRMLTEAYDGFTAGPSQVAFWDGLAFVLVVTINFGLLGYLSVRDLRARRAVA